MWMIGLLKRRGFIGIFLLSSVPNMAFDLCGMCCGHFMMPFSTFFSAVLLGKAGVKVSFFPAVEGFAAAVVVVVVALCRCNIYRAQGE